MGNQPTKCVGEDRYKDFKNALEVLREHTPWDEGKLDDMFKDNACQITKEIPKVNFEIAMQRIGLLDCVAAICATPVQDSDGHLKTLHLNAEVVRENIVETLWNLFDTDRNGSVSFEEFVIGVSLILRGTTEQKAAALFKIQDVNQDGVLTKEEMRLSIKKTTTAGRKIILASLPAIRRDFGRKEAKRIKEISRQMNLDSEVAKMVEEIFQGADADQNDTISLDEFVTYSKTHPTVLLTIYRITGDMPE